MKVAKILLVTVNVLLFSVGITHSSSTTVISSINEYGGKTIETVYSKDDRKSEKLVRDIIYFDRNNNIVKVGYLYSVKFIESRGISKVIIHVVNNTKIVMEESYYVNNAANKLGLNKMITYYGDDERLNRLESYYSDKSAAIRGFNKATLYVEGLEGSRFESDTTERFSAESGVDKIIGYLDKDKRLMKLEYYKDGHTVLLSEDKVALIRERLMTNFKELNF